MNKAYVVIADSVAEAAQLIRNGESPTAAVQKIAEERVLNTDFIDRVVESINTSQMLSILKSADRRREFTLADAAEIKRSLVQPQTKVASCRPMPVVRDFYGEDLAARYLPKYQIPKLQPTPMARTSEESLYKTVGVIQKAASICANGVAQLQQEIMEKAGAVIDSSRGQSLFLSCAYRNSRSAYKDRALELLRCSAQALPSVKYAGAMNTGAFDDLCTLLQEEVALMKQALELDETAQLSRKVLTKVAMEKASLDKEAVGFSLLSTGLGQGSKALGALQAGYEERKTGTTGLDSIKKFVDAIKKARMLKSLMSSDEILREQDSRSVTDAYNMLNELTPMGAKNKQVTRSFLRQAVTHPETLAGFEANEYLKLEKTLRQLESGNLADTTVKVSPSSKKAKGK